MADIDNGDDSQDAGGTADASNSDSGADPADAADAARDSFPDEEPDATSPCHPETPGGTPPAGTCTAAQIKTKLDACDGGTDVWNKAKTAAGKDPVVTVATPSSGFKAESDSTGAITISPQDCCNAMQSMIHELTNVSHGPDFTRIDSDAAQGNVAREDYAKANEKIEYDGVKNTLKAFDSCKASWGCGPEAKAKFDGFRSAHNFDEYYDQISEDHKNFYRNYWDSPRSGGRSSYKDAYNQK